MESIADARAALDSAWPLLVMEARQILAGELHYQAMAYHAFREVGVPVAQIGMNVKMWISGVVSPHFTALSERKHEDYRGGFEPIPDLVLFRSSIGGNWQRRSHTETLKNMLLAVEIKASERHKSRLGRAEIERDIAKLEAHRHEARHRGHDFAPVMMVVDTATDRAERMRDDTLTRSREFAARLAVAFYYVSPQQSIRDWPSGL